MLKKLQNLLFEEDEEEVVEEEEEEVEVRPARRKAAEPLSDKKPVSPAPAPSSAPVIEPAKPVMSRVEMTQPLQVTREEKKPAASNSAFNSNNSVFKTPASVPHASPRPIKDPAPAVQETPKSSFSGLTFDTKKEEPAPAKKPAKAPKAVRTASVYEFKPVISPMFGVDEKDMEAMTLTAKATRINASADENVSKVISPIYGSNLDAKNSSAPSTSEKSGRMENMAYSPAARRQEDKIPEFSLDDILSARDEEFSKQSVGTAEVRTPDVDETVVIDSDHFGKYDRKGDTVSDD
ncbi:MAG: hypothetical protein IKE16_02720 [Solobacterium sp.]|nr:hypothetical protein [Solobacterium sp.]